MKSQQHSIRAQRHPHCCYSPINAFHRQQGLTGIAIILMLAVGAFFLAIAFTVFPPYMENFSVKSHVHDLKKLPDAKSMTKTDITKQLFRRFDIDNVTSVTEDDVNFVEVPNGWRIDVDYEVRKHFIGNVDLVLVFHEEVEVPH